MAINHKKYYNASAGKNIGRDSLNVKEGKRLCGIPEKLKEMIEESEDPEAMAISLIGFAKLLKEQRSPSILPTPQEKNLA